MSEQNWGCLDKMSEVNFSPAESLNADIVRVGSHVVFAWIHCTDVRIHCTDIQMECK